MPINLTNFKAALDLAGLSVIVSGPDAIGGMPEVEETGSTFEANSSTQGKWSTRSWA